MSLRFSGKRHYLACDLGAESGRVISGTLAGEKLSLNEVHRFSNVPIRGENHLHWNFPRLLEEIRKGLETAAKSGLRFESISTDSWGVDYVLYDGTGEIMPPVVHYRDPRTRRGVERAFQKTAWEEIFEETGIQLMPINTLFQLCSEDEARLMNAGFLLGVGDAVNYWLSGFRGIEVSMASTFQLYNPRTKGWSQRLIQKLGLPAHPFPEIVPSGVRLGAIKPSFPLANLEVVATCSHDTGAAVAGVPAVGEDWAYLSSGTWSLLGVEIKEPIITPRSRELNFTNEVGFGETVRFLKNLSGLWLVQECRREWTKSGRNWDYKALTECATAAPAFRSLINPSLEEFIAPASMPAQITEFCRRTDQPVPADEGALIRCALESLALLYRRTLRQIESLTGKRISQVHIVGGGSNNPLLNQLTADALQIPVLAGPSEATAAGNILIQAIALGHLNSLSEARQIVRGSFELREFTPRPVNWSEPIQRFESFFLTC